MGHEQLSAQQLDELTPNLESTLSMLVSRARNGDSTAREEIIGQCRNYLLLVANEELDQQLQAKCAPSDLVQDTLIAAAEHFEGFQGRSLRAAEMGGLAGEDLLQELKASEEFASLRAHPQFALIVNQTE